MFYDIPEGTRYCLSNSLASLHGGARTYLLKCRKPQQLQRGRVHPSGRAVWTCRFRPSSYTPLLIRSLRTFPVSLASLNYLCFPTFPKPSPIKIHTSSTSPAAKANNIVDSSARNSHHLLLRPYPVPSMRHLHSRHLLTLFADVQIHRVLTNSLTDCLTKPLKILPLRLPIPSRCFYVTHTTPGSPIFTITIRLLCHRAIVRTVAPTGQFLASSPSYRLVCTFFETPHHLFVECHRFAETRNRSSQDVSAVTSVLLHEAKTNDQTTELYLHTARCLFVDDTSTWPLRTSRYYLGTIPKVTTFPCITSALVTKITFMAHSVYPVSSSHPRNIQEDAQSTGSKAPCFRPSPSSYVP
ncbi:hypothetical protein DFH29DRAFT_214323 [Suillus ampliporus]|nr:hypothetical protein DFH29DRAFT_214323 [Suillus ampliporus]